MNRRRIFAGALVAAIAPIALAQPRQRTVGYLSNGVTAEHLARALAARGYVEGRDVKYLLRVSPGDRAGAEKAAAELVQARPDVLVAFGALNVRSLAALTRAIPIVCGGTADPVGLGFAKTLRRPGGNITGISYGVPEMAQILVGLVRVVRPKLQRIVTVVEAGDGAFKGWGEVLRSIEVAARADGVDWKLAPVDTVAALERALAPLDAATSAVYYVDVAEAISVKGAAALANARRLVSFTPASEGVRHGILMHYSVDHADVGARVAAIVDQLLRGANAAEIPFELPDRTTFIVNRATAKAIGVELPPEILTRATEIVG